MAWLDRGGTPEQDSESNRAAAHQQRGVCSCCATKFVAAHLALHIEVVGGISCSTLLMSLRQTQRHSTMMVASTKLVWVVAGGLVGRLGLIAVANNQGYDKIGRHLLLIAKFCAALFIAAVCPAVRVCWWCVKALRSLLNSGRIA